MSESGSKADNKKHAVRKGIHILRYSQAMGPLFLLIFISVPFFVLFETRVCSPGLIFYQSFGCLASGLLPLSLQVFLFIIQIRQGQHLVELGHLVQDQDARGGKRCTMIRAWITGLKSMTAKDTLKVASGMGLFWLSVGLGAVLWTILIEGEMDTIVFWTLSSWVVAFISKIGIIVWGRTGQTHRL